MTRTATATLHRICVMMMRSHMASAMGQAAHTLQEELALHRSLPPPLLLPPIAMMLGQLPGQLCYQLLQVGQYAVPRALLMAIHDCRLRRPSCRPTRVGCKHCRLLKPLQQPPTRSSA